MTQNNNIGSEKKSSIKSNVVNRREHELTSAIVIGNIGVRVSLCVGVETILEGKGYNVHGFVNWVKTVSFRSSDNSSIYGSSPLWLQ